MRNKVAFLLVLVACLQSGSGTVFPPEHDPELMLRTSNGNGAMIFKLNTAIDFLLSVARWMFTKRGHLTLSLPDINSEFGHDYYKGMFTAKGGFFENIGSLHRTGDIAFIKVNSSLSLEVALGLSEIEAGYSNYTLSILKIRQSGKVHANVGKNSIRMKMTFVYSPKCSFNLEVIEFDQLGGIKIDINGLGAFQLLFDELSKWLISNFEERFRIVANKKMHERLRLVVQRQSDLVCRWWPSF